MIFLIVTLIVLAVAGLIYFFWYLANARLYTSYTVQPSVFLKRFLQEFKAKHPHPLTTNVSIDRPDLFVHCYCGVFQDRQYLSKIIVRYKNEQAIVVMKFQAHYQQPRLKFFDFKKEFVTNLDVAAVENQCWQALEEFKTEMVRHVPGNSKIRWIAAWAFLDVDVDARANS